MRRSKSTGLAVALGVVAALTLPALPAAAVPDPMCHEAYKTCLPVAKDLNCDDIADSDKPVKLKDKGNDPYRLDADGDGKGCDAKSGSGSGSSGGKSDSSESADDDASATGTGTGGSSDDDNQLPVTGFAAWTAAGVGAALLAAGAVFLVLTRRRKVRYVA